MLATAMASLLPHVLSWASGGAVSGNDSSTAMDFTDDTELERIPKSATSEPLIAKSVPISAVGAALPMTVMEPHIVQNYAYPSASLNTEHVRYTPDTSFGPSANLNIKIQGESDIALLLSTFRLVMQGYVALAPNWGNGTTWNFSEEQYGTTPTANKRYPSIDPIMTVGRNNIFSDLFETIRIYINNTIVEDVKTVDFPSNCFFLTTTDPDSNARSKSTAQILRREGLGVHDVALNDKMYQFSYGDWWVGKLKNHTGIWNATPPTGNVANTVLTFRLPHSIFNKPQILYPGFEMRIELVVSKTALHYYNEGSKIIHYLRTDVTAGTGTFFNLDYVPWRTMVFNPTAVSITADKLQMARVAIKAVEGPIVKSRDYTQLSMFSIKAGIKNKTHKSWVWSNQAADTNTSTWLSWVPPSTEEFEQTLQTTGNTPAFYVLNAQYTDNIRAPLAAGQATADTPYYCMPTWTGSKITYNNIPCYIVKGYTLAGTSYGEDDENKSVNENYIDFKNAGMSSYQFNEKSGLYNNELMTSTGFPDDNVKDDITSSIIEKCTDPALSFANGSAFAAADRTNISLKQFVSGAPRNASIITAKLNSDAAGYLSLQRKAYPHILHLSHVRTMREVIQPRAGEVKIKYKLIPFSVTAGVPYCRYFPNDATNCIETTSTLNDVKITFIPISRTVVNYNASSVKVNNYTDMQRAEDGTNRV